MIGAFKIGNYRKYMLHLYFPAGCFMQVLFLFVDFCKRSNKPEFFNFHIIISKKLIKDDVELQEYYNKNYLKYHSSTIT